MEGGPGIGGRPIIAQDIRKLKDFAYLARWENAFDLSDNLTAVFGASSLLGPNSSGPAGSTWIYGFDMKWRWQPANSFRGYPFLTWQTEYMRRHYEAAAASMDVTAADGHVDTVTFPADTLEDWGMYTQLLYGPQINWTVGMRLEYADGRGVGYNHGGRDGDPFRNERYRGVAAGPVADVRVRPHPPAVQLRSCHPPGGLRAQRMDGFRVVGMARIRRTVF